MATIEPTENGPYRVAGSPSLLRPSGKSYPVEAEVWLCRCGGSKNKPFCDGTHGTNGFKSATLADRAKNKRATYVGKSITIFDNRAICAHAGFCTDGLKEVFLEDASPWIAPDGATVEKVIETIEKPEYAVISLPRGAGSGEESANVRLLGSGEWMSGCPEGSE